MNGFSIGRAAKAPRRRTDGPRKDASHVALIRETITDGDLCQAEIRLAQRDLDGVDAHSLDVGADAASEMTGKTLCEMHRVNPGEVRKLPERRAAREAVVQRVNDTLKPSRPAYMSASSLKAGQQLKNQRFQSQKPAGRFPLPRRAKRTDESMDLRVFQYVVFAQRSDCIGDPSMALACDFDQHSIESTRPDHVSVSEFRAFVERAVCVDSQFLSAENFSEFAREWDRKRRALMAVPLEYAHRSVTRARRTHIGSQPNRHCRTAGCHLRILACRRTSYQPVRQLTHSADALIAFRASFSTISPAR